MENRRQDYRHAFPPGERFAVQLEAPGGRWSATGEVVDLSLGGMAVRLDAPAAAFGVDDRILARLRVPSPLALNAAVAHAGEGGRRLGLRFLSSASGAADGTRERVLWAFLLDAQRRALQRLRLAGEGRGEPE